MSTHCLICDSTAVISKDAAKAIALLICTLNGFLRAAQQPCHSQPKPPMCDSPVEQAFNLMLDGVAGAVNSWTDSQAFIRDVQRYQFMDYDCLCLRCGAKFDASAPSE